MPQKVLKFTGINRKVNEFQATGTCEELINLRPESGGLRVVRPKHELENRTSYSKVYEHSFGNTNNIIAVDTSGNIVWVNAEGGKTYIQSSIGLGSEIEISTAGNVLLINYIDKQKNIAYRFEDGQYINYSISAKTLKNIDIDLFENFDVSVTATAEDNSAAALERALHAAASRFTAEYNQGLCGAAVVGLTYEYEDGSEDWSTGFIVANATRYHKVKEPAIGSDNIVTVYGVSTVGLRYEFDSKDIVGVKRINIYTSKQVFPYSVESEYGKTTKIVKVPLDELNLDGQLMYYQGSIDIDKYGIVAGTYNLRFSDDITGESVMDVTSGCIERTGKTFSYNNRFFYYDSTVNHIIQSPTIQQAPSQYATGEIAISKWIAYVKFNKEWKLINNIYKIVDGSVLDFIYPLAGIKELAFVKVDVDDYGNVTAPYEEVFFVSLKDSSAYNYSYAFDITPDIKELSHNSDFYIEINHYNQIWGNEFSEKVFLRKEDNSINASAQFNPFVFPVKYSYSIGGKVLDMATAYMPISSTQIGQYPVTVFTSNGIFSMEQGDSSVLFSNIVPIQPLVIRDKAVSTPHGIFFISSNNVYVLSGREVSIVSDALHGEIESNIKNNDIYKRLCFRTGEADDLTMKVSGRNFEEFIANAALSYDPLQNEVYINGRDVDIINNNGANIGVKKFEYAYILNLNTMSFHKTSRRYFVYQNGGRYALADGEYAFSLVDLHEEDKPKAQPILLQSRPMPLETFYTHIQRLILLVDTKLEGKQHLYFSVFGSDNLHDWKCIISSQKQDAILRQIRTNRAAKSYRDYVILINGLVGADTDLSDIIADYTVVSRRLG
jgi:hypothetical protein